MEKHHVLSFTLWFDHLNTSFTSLQHIVLVFVKFMLVVYRFITSIYVEALLRLLLL